MTSERASPSPPLASQRGFFCFFSNFLSFFCGVPALSPGLSHGTPLSDNEEKSPFRVFTAEGGTREAHLTSWVSALKLGGRLEMRRDGDEPARQFFFFSLFLRQSSGLRSSVTAPLLPGPRSLCPRQEKGDAGAKRRDIWKLAGERRSLSCRRDETLFFFFLSEERAVAALLLLFSPFFFNSRTLPGKFCLQNEN